jgi:hypothetical protein
MKKLLGIVVLGLLLSGNAYSNTIKDMILTCDSNEQSLFDLSGNLTTSTKKTKYEIHVVDNEASLHWIEDVTIFDYKNFKLKNVSEKEYYFENKNNNERLFAKIALNRIDGSGLVSQVSDKTVENSLSEMVRLIDCKLKDNKPKF